MIARTLLEKLDNEFDKLAGDKNSDFAKAFIIGAAEGVIDTMLIAGSLATISWVGNAMIKVIKK